jgi:phosphinothricin acetyltransferase
MTCPLLSEMLHWLAAAPRSRRRQLEILRELDDRRLADLGISRGEALRGHADPDRPTPTERPNRPCLTATPLP